MPRYNDVVINQAGHPVSGVSVTVYNGNSQVLASLFSDEGLTQPIANPQFSDGMGRIAFSVSSGDYTLALQGGSPAITPQSYLVSVGGVGGGGGGGSQSQIQTYSGVQNGVNQVFVLTTTPTNINAVQVFKNGQLELVNGDYTLVGNTLTFIVPPAVDDVITVYF